MVWIKSVSLPTPQNNEKRFLCVWRARQRTPNTQKPLEKDVLRLRRNLYERIALRFERPWLPITRN
jgi:hypothetical protein